MRLSDTARCCLLAPESPCITSFRGPRPTASSAATQNCILTLRPAALKPIPSRRSDAPRAIATPSPEGAGLPSATNAAQRGAEPRRACSEPPSQRFGSMASPAEKAWTLRALGVCPDIDDAANQRRPQTGPPTHEFNKIESIKTLQAFGLSTGILDASHQRRRAAEAPVQKSSRIDVERAALAHSDITCVMARRYFHEAQLLSSYTTNQWRLADLNYCDIDVHRGRRHFADADDCVQPWARPSYDDALGSTTQATRMHFFKIKYAADRYAELIGRPHIRKPSEIPKLPAARAEWLRLKGVEEGWQLLGSWQKPVCTEKKAFLPVQPAVCTKKKELLLGCAHVHQDDESAVAVARIPRPLRSIDVRKMGVGIDFLSKESFIQASAEKSWSLESYKESCDASTAVPEDDETKTDSALDQIETSCRSSPRLSSIIERNDDAMTSDKVYAAKLPLALRRVIGAAMVGREETQLYASASLSARISLLVGSCDRPNQKS